MARAETNECRRLEKTSMKRSWIKLISAALLVVVALVVVVASSYAWFSLSDTPSVAGVQVNVGGSNTIKIAPDITDVTDEGTVHYPGEFSDSLNVSNESAYAYLQDIVSLSLVSTADGIHWYFPTYYDSSDGETSGTQGTLRDISEFLLDDTLAYANLEELPTDDAVAGGYAMVDFWVVSPQYCRLRVSVGEGSGGSYLVSLPELAIDGNGDPVLNMADASLSACARVGFLANTQTVTNFSMSAYADSAHYDPLYRSLKGIYQEKGEHWNHYPAQFTIYEPNADYHSTDGVYTLARDGMNYRLCENGSYVRTTPIGNVNGLAQLIDVTERTTVQTATEWLSANGSEAMIQQIFQTYLRGVSSPDTTNLMDGFYRGYLGYQCGTYVQKGSFIKSTGNLIRAIDDDGVVEPDLFGALTTAGASDDVMIVELEKNVPQRLRMFVWIEGQDVDCSDVTVGGGLLLNLELAASTD